MTTATKSSPASKAHTTPKDAIALLKADHEAVSTLFADYEKTHSVAKKKALVSEICTALSVHTHHGCPRGRSDGRKWLTISLCRSSQMRDAPDASLADLNRQRDPPLQRSTA